MASSTIGLCGLLILQFMVLKTKQCPPDCWTDVRDPKDLDCDEILKTSKCLESCKGDLNHLVARSLYDRTYKEQCTEGRKVINTYNVSEKSHSSPSVPPAKIHPTCNFSQKSTGYKTCGLYGFSHVKSFYNFNATCELDGTNSLVDNSYFTIQVTTRKKLTSYSSIVMATILIKRKNHCTSQKMYEVVSNFPLSRSFHTGEDNGSKRNGDSVNLTVIDFDEHRQKGIIYLRHINTTIVIRKIGDLIGFTVQMPNDIIFDKSKNQDQHDLCQYGCQGLVQSDSNSETSYMNVCSNGNKHPCCDLGSAFFTWCLLGSLAEGEVNNNIVEASFSAQEDMLGFDPDFRHTSKPFSAVIYTDESTYSSSSSVRYSALLVPLVLFFHFL